MKKRIVAFLLAIVIAFGVLPMLPTSTFAYEIGYDGMGPKVITGGQRDFKWPVPGYYNIQSCFYDHRNHCAIDISANQGTSIVASYDGTVVKVVDGGTSYYGDGFGNYVVVKHNYKTANGTTITLYSRYNHMYSTSVSEGTQVKRGETVLGKVGQTGKTEGPHLDFQICYGGWSPYQTYSIDPYANDLLELPSNLTVYDSWACGPAYLALVKAQYATPVTPGSQDPGKAAFKNMKSQYQHNEPITFLWNSTVNTTHYNFYLYKRNNAGDWFVDEHTFYVQSGFTRCLADGSYRALIQSYNSNAWKDDNSDWRYTESDYFYFSVGSIKVKFDANGGSLSSAANASHIINGYNGARDSEWLVVYNISGQEVDTNEFGCEVAINSTGRVTSKRNYGSSNHLTVPSGGFVLSGHTTTVNSGGYFVENIEVGDYAAFDTNTNTAYAYKTQDAYLAAQKYVTSGNTYSSLPTPTRTNYDFDGWYTASSGGSKVTSSTTVTATSDHTLYAHWTSNCASGHNYTYAVTTTPTTSATGKLTGTCSRCSATTTVTLPKLNTTDYTYAVTKAATCTATGTGRYTWKTTTYGTFYFDVTIAKTAHTYKDTVTAPTCTAQGYTTHICTGCGDTYKDTYTDALGHNWDGGIITTQPTETSEGIKTFTCSRCGTTKTEPVPALSHTHSYSTVVTPPTCTGKGYTTYTCACGDSYITDYVGALGHNFVGGVCTRCGADDPNYDPPVHNDPCEGYTDINRSGWYHSAADFVIERGLMGSTKADTLTFEPNTKVSRAMVASILYTMAGKPDVIFKGTFTDVKYGMWFTNAIEWCAQNGLASGKGNGKFDPNGNVTRQELAVFMMQMAQYLGKDTSGRADLGGFADWAKVPSWAKTYVRWAVDAELISGKASGGKTYLAPADNASRAELAAIIRSFVQNIAETD